MTPRALRIAFLSCLVIAGVAAYTLVTRMGTVPSARDSAAAMIDTGFDLVDQDGNPASGDRFRGRWMLVFFGFTHCPDVCPTTLQTASTALGDLPEGAAAQVQPIMITVDPARDGPAEMKSYVGAFPGGWIGLTGTPEQVGAAAKGFRTYFRRVDAPAYPDGYTMDHSAFVYLIGPDGLFRDVMSAQDSAEAMTATIEKAMAAG